MMTSHNVTLTLWILVTAVLLQNVMAGPSALRNKTNSTSIESKSLTPQASIGIPRRLPSPWAGKLSNLRGRPRQRTSTTTSSTTSTTTTTTTSAPNRETEPTVNITNQDSTFRRRMDTFDSAASENPLSVVWPLRARPAASKRFRIPTPTTPAPQVLLKLLQPKPTRPAIYSLDGFVPKPSIQRIVSTEAPLHFKKTDLQLLSSVPRRRKANRYSKEDDDDDDYQYVTRGRRRKKPVSRYTAFARKGVPGEDYPVYTYIPQTDFDCGAQPGPGLYADPFTDCQVWHMCPGGNLSPRHSFLCPNGTIFNQKKRICDWWYNVDCRKHSRKIRSYSVEFPEDEIVEELE
ncbi:syndecan-3-like [Stegodyphus dumicola]|uniref:syndecan-3-like n=1 Tax=Stegodyphus dumicola TaxID=202533 RepID=UPI0015B1E47E|nr:syndecan-3-like [Stegodyphus dumicola]XP_035210808.1 syndecan-3-like [Stegodyphus dumicola]XP_035210809.1 syndecan-3-like [Stegodyphus dumicola]